MRFLFSFSALFLISWLCCCSTDKGMIAMADTSEMMPATAENAAVTKVEVSGDENAYTFSVTIASPDTGCTQYADWWEVVDLEGNLIYRRILTHSHVDEQPFTRSGGTVAISETTEVFVRAHMNNSGYGSTAQRGSVANGFSAAELDSDFAAALQEQAPLPDGCAF
ncbi:hypothetical protein FGM00_02730 [Aggregatimonas sangjinii]|uniref:Uncharacterized protein n=1 Tax=Aggregatimonas sangjinii TaxID=2583587 RepID=A0A5B7SR19_9FLAO|nr:hypothetical protein [Aggregatimonas sangjinii]QCW99083.1 hypothetical protein FGM00_02730 [Aggregatimonas sangjinii]